MAISDRNWGIKLCWASWLALGGAIAVYSNYANAQIAPDATLGAESSVVTPNTGGVEAISGGATRGANLFHSDDERIAVEIKTFLNPSAISEFHTALGQFINYRFALKADDPQRILYLAVPREIYDTFFIRQFVQLIIQEYQLKLIVYDTVDEVIVRWQK